jgi:outer membrane protein
MQENKNDDTEAAYREAMGKLQSVMGAEQQRVVGLLNAEFERVIQDYRKSKGLALIVARKSVLDADDAIDITKDIVAEMGKVKIDFAAKAEVKETPAPEKAEEKAPEAAPEKEDAKAE